jgi:hypothetical protein
MNSEVDLSRDESQKKDLKIQNKIKRSFMFSASNIHPAKSSMSDARRVVEMSYTMP